MVSGVVWRYMRVLTSIFNSCLLSFSSITTHYAKNSWNVRRDSDGNNSYRIFIEVELCDCSCNILFLCDNCGGIDKRNCKANK